MNIVILGILLIVLGYFIYLYLQDESQLGNCNSANDCGRYDVNYIKDRGYVCVNDQVMIDASLKSKILMFKYAPKKAIKEEPLGCSCIENQCEISN